MRRPLISHRTQRICSAAKHGIRIYAWEPCQNRQQECRDNAGALFLLTCMAAARRVGFLLRSPREDAPEPADADEDPADLPNDLDDDEPPAASRLRDVVVVAISSVMSNFLRAVQMTETEMMPPVIRLDHPALLVIHRPSPLASERRWKSRRKEVRCFIFCTSFRTARPLVSCLYCPIISSASGSKYGNRSSRP